MSNNHDTIQVLTKANFDAFLKTDTVAVVYFWAEWCEPCHAFRPIFEKVAASHDNVVFGSIDVENEKELMDDFNVRSVPMVMVFREHVALCMESGCLPEATLTDLIEQAMNLDMQDVHQTIAQKLLDSQ